MRVIRRRTIDAWYCRSRPFRIHGPFRHHEPHRFPTTRTSSRYIEIVRLISERSSQTSELDQAEVACGLKFNDGKIENYVGESGIGAGLDLNWKREDELMYTVMALSQDITPGAGGLAGKFVGGKGNVSLGVGSGVGVLVGGSDKNIPPSGKRGMNRPFSNTRREPAVRGFSRIRELPPRPRCTNCTCRWSKSSAWIATMPEVNENA